MKRVVEAIKNFLFLPEVSPPPDSLSEDMLHICQQYRDNKEGLKWLLKEREKHLLEIEELKDRIKNMEQAIEQG